MSVVSRLQAGNGEHLFYALKITGLPYIFTSVHNPYSVARFAGGALALPSGYSAIGGMDLPDENLTQSIADIIGGIASAEKMNLRLIDFDAFDADGRYQVLARLFSPGIATSTPGGYFELMSDIPTTHDTGDTVDLRTGTVTPADGFYTIGTETLRLEDFTAPSGGVSTGTIVGGRNRFPCSDVYPVIPYHRVVRDETDGAAIGKNILVTPYGAPFTMVGRSAAFYIGALDSSGAPLAEDQWQLRLLGRIKGVGDSGGATYEIEIESIIDDLKGALVAPGLGCARIKDDQILLPATTGTAGTNANWLECDMYRGKPGLMHLKHWRIVLDGSDVPDGNYTLEKLLRKVNDVFADPPDGFGVQKINPPHATTVTGDDGLLHVCIDIAKYKDVALNEFTIEGGRNTFLSALGFESNESGEVIIAFDDWIPLTTNVPGLQGTYRSVAPRPAPNVFIPASQAIFSDPARFAVQGLDGSTSQHFFTDQGDDRAFVQLGDGTLVELQDIDTTDGPLKLTTGPRWRWSMGTRELINEESPEPFYYVGWGSKATLRQVVVAGDRDAEVDAGLFVGRLLASHDEASALDDLNYYPEGVGLGWNQVLDGDSVRAISSYGRSWPREFIVTNQTKLDDILLPILKVYGLAVVWDPETSQVVFRPLRFPTAANAHNVSLSDSNRTRVEDETARVIDASNIRTSWLLKWGWDFVEEKFTAPDINIIDNTVASTGIVEKPEKIEDKTLWIKGDMDGFAYLAELFARGFLYQQPWMKCSRTLNRFGLTLAPGTYHLIVDRNLVNPFTGRRGVTAADRLYGMLIEVISNPQQPDKGTCTFLLNQYRQSGLFRSWSPTALVDYDAAGHGYNTGTGVWTMAHRYSSHDTNHDGYDLRAGDTVRAIAWNSGEAALAYDQTFTLTAVAADGSTVTGPSGLPAVGADVEVLLVLRDYANATATRQEEVAFQGDAQALIIGAVAGAGNHRWA